YTENGSATYKNSGNPAVDFFFHVVPKSPSSDIICLLRLSWEHDPLLTLKLICNLRGVRGTGKSDKEGFYTAALWLHENHPKTLALNMGPISGFGYLKDMPEILFRLLEGSNTRKPKEDVSSFPYRYELLKKDIEFFKKGDLYKLGLSAKWCPTIDSSYDEVTLLCESIARRVFPKDEYEEYKDMEDVHYAFTVRDRLRKEVLVPLRKALDIPEVYISAKKWDTLPYNKVPSVAMKLYKTLFYKHDEERFVEYLEKVKSGKATIAAGALLPHEIIASLKNDENGGEVAELQWKRMVDDLAKKGKMNNCIAISDVSGSMMGEPMEVSVALGLLISELSEEPWKGKLITFNTNPRFHTIQGKRLKEKTNFIRQMDWGGSTDLQKVFDRILEVAVSVKIPEEQMIKRLFIFSDMEFNQASQCAWETDYKVIQRKYKEKGYEKVPEIVFWNLRHSMATPVPSTEPGVALVSGFSKNLVTLFLEEGGVLNPEAAMLAAVAKPEYDTLVVYD
uniref:Uncharacterized protein n=1 Tax=Chenopodium quinoa TaxID=63459 RepID=A0A803MU98_CHEQI